MAPAGDGGKPTLTSAQADPVAVAEALDAEGELREIRIPGERPLALYVDRREIVTLMTMGQMPEALAVGYLRNQRLVGSLGEIESVSVDWEVEACAVVTRGGLREEALGRRTVTSGCGQGTMFGEFLEGMGEASLSRDGPLRREELFGTLALMRDLDTVYKQAGAVHGCALLGRAAGAPEMLVHVEDIGRHNAVDSIAGWMWLNGVDGADRIFYTTGRLTSEMVLKCAQMGVPFLVSRSGSTRMGYEIARRTGITMVGRAINRRFLVLSGREHFESPQPEHVKSE